MRRSTPGEDDEHHRIAGLIIMSWKDDGSGNWTWVDDGSGNPQNPPIGQPPSAQPATFQTSHTPSPTQPDLAPPPAAPATTFTAGPATPPSLPDIDPTTGQPRPSGSQQLPDGTTGKVIQNSDGSRVVVDANGNIVQRVPAAGQTPAAAAAPATSTSGTGLSSFGSTGAGPGVLDLSGQTTPTAPHAASPEEQTDIDAYQKEILDATQAIFTQTGKIATTDQLQQITANAQAHHPLAAKFNSQIADLGAASNNQFLVNRTVAQTAGDIARISDAGATGQTGLAAAANQATATGQQTYADSLAAAAAARATGTAGLNLAVNQGAAATGAASALAAPLAGLANYDQNNGAIARGTADTALGQANTSLSAAQQQVQRLTQLAAAGDSTAVAQLQQFQGSGGTAGSLLSAPTVAAATGSLGAFQGSEGTAPTLSTLPTALASTSRAAGFGASTGQANPLAALDTRSALTTTLAGFQGNNGAAQPLANLDTSTEATGQLGAFQAGGNTDLARLEQIASGSDIGPSAAEALQRKNADQGFAQNIALARSGRNAGDSASALRQALFTNAAGSQQLGVDVAATRAAEAATARGQNITAATAAAGTATTQSGQELSALQTKQTAETTALQTKVNALVASGQMTQVQAQEQLDALKTAQAADTAAIAQKSSNLTSSGQQLQVASQQSLDAIKVQQAGDVASLTAKVNALIAAGQMTQTEAAQRLDALKSQQQGQLASFAQQGTNLANAGQQQQTQAQQQLAALQAAASGETAAEATRVQAATAAGSTANTSAATNADVAKTFATLGLNYDVNSGNVMNDAGQIVMTGQQVAATLTGSGLSNQAQQGANAANITSSGLQALTNLTNTSVDAQKATAVLGVQTAAAITSLSQGELAQLAQIVATQNAGALQKFALDNHMAIAIEGQSIQQQAAVLSALGVLAGGAAGLIGKTIDAGANS
jgi:hypothetical protein